MQFILRPLIRLSRPGPQDSSDLKKDKLLRRIAVICAALCLPYYFIFDYFNLNIARIFVFPTISIYIASILLNKFRLHSLSKLLVVFGTSLSLAFYANILGPLSGAQFLLFALVPLPLLLYGYHQIRWIIPNIMIPIGTYFLLEFTRYSWIQETASISISTLFYVRCFAILTTFLLFILSISAYFVSNHLYELALTEKNRELENTNSKLIATMVHLEESIKQQMEMKSQATFASLMRQIAHEIKNPLHFVSGSAEVVKSSKVLIPERVHKQMQSIEDAIARINTIMNAMMKYGDSHNGFSPGRVSVEKLLSTMKDLAIGTCAIKGIEFTTECSAADEIFADDARIGQTLINLVSNAIQYTPRDGKISLSATQKIYRPSAELEPIEGICISVSDTGCGIPANQLQTIFTPSMTSKNADHNFGMGLAIVFQTISESNGLITVDSTVNVGTTFNIYLPKFDATKH